MGEVSLLSSIANSQMIGQKNLKAPESKEELSLFAMLFQGMMTINPSQQSTELKENSSETISVKNEIVEIEQDNVSLQPLDLKANIGQPKTFNSETLGVEQATISLSQEVFDTANNGSQPVEDLLKWFNNLPEETQKEATKFIVDSMNQNKNGITLPGELLELIKVQPEAQEATKAELPKIQEMVTPMVNKTADTQVRTEKAMEPFSPSQSRIKKDIPFISIKHNNQPISYNFSTTSAQLPKQIINPAVNSIDQTQTIDLEQLASNTGNQVSLLTNDLQPAAEVNANIEIDSQQVDLSKLQTNNLFSIRDPKNVDTVNKIPVKEHMNFDQNFSNELGKVLIKNLKLPNGISETKIQLHPQELGQIDVKLVANNGQISAQIFTETAIGKELLESQISQLKQSLTVQGYQVDRIEVQQSNPSSNANQDHLKNSFNFNGQQSRQFAREQAPQKQNFYRYSDEAEDSSFYEVSISGIDYTV